MRSIPNYVCTTCGNGFPTGSSARRHLRNVEGGVGVVVTEANYRIGLTTGMFIPPPPRPPPRYEKKADPSWTDIAFEEFVKGYWRRMGERICDERFPRIEDNWKDVLLQYMMLRMIQGA